MSKPSTIDILKILVEQYLEQKVNFLRPKIIEVENMDGGSALKVNTEHI